MTRYRTLCVALSLLLCSPAFAQSDLRPADVARLDGFTTAIGDALLQALAGGNSAPGVDNMPYEVLHAGVCFVSHLLGQAFHGDAFGDEWLLRVLGSNVDLLVWMTSGLCSFLPRSDACMAPLSWLLTGGKLRPNSSWRKRWSRAARVRGTSALPTNTSQERRTPRPATWMLCGAGYSDLRPMHVPESAPRASAQVSPGALRSSWPIRAKLSSGLG